MLIRKFVFYDWKTQCVVVSFFFHKNYWVFFHWSSGLFVCLFVCNWVSPIELWNAPIEWALLFPFSYLSQLIGWRYHLTCQYWSGFYKVHTYHPHHTTARQKHFELLYVSNNPSTHRASWIIWSDHKYCCRAQCNRPPNLKSSSKLIIPFVWIMLC